MGCKSSAPRPLILRTTLLKTNHPSLNAIIEEAEKSLQELARICNPLEVAIDSFFSVCGQTVDSGFANCLLALVVALIANCEEGGFKPVAESPGMSVKIRGVMEQLTVEYQSWRQLASELQFTINDLSDSLMMLMDCAATSHRLSQALVVLIKTEELRVVDIRKVMVILEENEEVIKTAAEMLHLNVRRAKLYSNEAGALMQWLRTHEGLSLVTQEAENARKMGLKCAEEVLQLRGRSVGELVRGCLDISVEISRN